MGNPWKFSLLVLSQLLHNPASALGFSFGVKAQTEMKIWCVVGMHMLKVF